MAVEKIGNVRGPEGDSVIEPFEVRSYPPATVTYTGILRGGSGALAGVWSEGGSFTATVSGMVILDSPPTLFVIYILRGVHDLDTIDSNTFAASVIAAVQQNLDGSVVLQAGQSYTWFIFTTSGGVQVGTEVDVTQIAGIAADGGVDPASIPAGARVNLEVTGQGKLQVQAAPKSTRENSGARLYGPYDVTYGLAPAIQDGFSPLVSDGTLIDEEGVTHVLSLQVVNGIMEARFAVGLDPVALTSGVGGSPGPYEERTALSVAGAGFDYGKVVRYPLVLEQPTPGFSATITFYPAQGAQDTYVQVSIVKQNDASWSDLGDGTNGTKPRVTASATFIAPEYDQAALGGQRANDPGFALGGSPSAPKPSAVLLFKATQVPAVAAQPMSGQQIWIGPMVDGDSLLTGFGNYNDNTGPIDIVSWSLSAGRSYYHGLTFQGEQVSRYRVLNDDWVWIPNIDPQGGQDGPTDYLATNAPVPGPGPIISQFRAVTGVNPPGLGNMGHVYDTAQLSTGPIYIVGSRELTTAERDAAHAAAPDGGWMNAQAPGGGGDGAACCWRSDDGGVTWTEAIKDFHPAGPNPYTRFYFLGQIEDRLFLPSFQPCLADGTLDPNGTFYGYWQMEPDETWTLKPPLDPEDNPSLGLGGIYAAEQALPRDAERKSWGGAAAWGSIYESEQRATIYTYTDRLVATPTLGTACVGRDEMYGRALEGHGYLTYGYDQDAGTVLFDGSGDRIPLDRIPGRTLPISWTFATTSTGDLLICTQDAVFKATRAASVTT